MKSQTTHRPRHARTMAFVVRTPVWWLACVAMHAHAAKVTELTPAGLPAALKADGVTVVQFTSPDPNCGYCRGQDRVFDDFAAAHTGKTNFFRIQWSPWRAFPKLDISETVYGLPYYYIFKAGRAVAESGSLKDATKLGKLIAGAEEGKVQERFDPAARKQPATADAPASKPAAPATAADRDALARLARRDLAREALNRCAAANPSEAEAYRSALAAWEGRHRPELAKGALLMITQTTRADAAEMSAITEAQARRLQNEAPMASPTPQGCSRLTSALAD